MNLTQKDHFPVSQELIMKKYLLCSVCLSAFAFCSAKTADNYMASFSGLELHYAIETQSESGSNQITLSNDFTDPVGFRVYSGYGRRLNKINPELGRTEMMHANSLVNGIVYGSDLVFYFNSARTCGFGFKFQVMHSEASTLMDYKTSSITGWLKDKVNITYLGPVYSQRFAFNEGQNVLMYNVGLGWLFYGWRGTVNKAEGNMSGKTTGLTLDLNYSRMIKEKLGIGFDMSLTMGALSSYDTSDLNGRTTVQLEQKEGLTQMGLLLQLLYKF